MRVKIDEYLPKEMVEIFHSAGHDAMTVQAERLNGAPDSQVLAACKRERRTLVTLDADFADTRLYPPAERDGLIVLGLKRQDKPYVLGIVRRLLHLLASEQVEQRLWIVEEDGVRIRR
jgi:predicted nuclease of predicted toxin-antitoxin system